MLARNDMDTNVINLFNSVPAANDSGFFARTYPAIQTPANQITFEQNLLSVLVSDLSTGLMQAEAARVQRGEIGRATWQVMGNRLRANIIPLLGNLPILGNLFKHTQVNTSNQELIFFITPRIIQT